MIKKLKILFKNKEAKTLATNFTYLSILQIVGYVFPILTLPYLARVIGVTKFGEIAFAAAVIVYFQTVVDWGFMFSATRDVARNRDDIDKVSQIFSNVMWSKIVMMIISFVILLVLIIFIPTFSKISTLLLINFCIIPGQIMFPDWLFQGLEKMKYITILNLFARSIFTAAIFIFIKEESDYILQPLLLSLGLIISGIIAMYMIIFRWKIKLYKPNVDQIKSTIKGGADLFINQLAPNLYNSFSVILLGFLGGPASTGRLDSGAKFINMSTQFMAVIPRTFYPFLSRKIDKHTLYAKVNIWLSILISIILFVSAPLLVKIFLTSEFTGAVNVIRIMSLSVFFLTLCSIYGSNYLILMGQERVLRNLTIISSVIGFAIAIPMVYFYDYIGVAITVTFTRALLGFWSYYAVKKYKNENRNTL